MSLKNKVVVITGAGSGIGKATAHLFASKGAKVIVSDINTENGEAVVKAIQEQGGEAAFVATNVAKYEEVENLIQQAVAQYGSLDVMVNNAGIGPDNMLPTSHATLADWDKVIAVNQTGVFYCMKLALQQMLQQGGGCIVNIASLAGLKASPNNISYAASKFAVVGMTKSAAMEYAKKNIRINAVCPGYTRSALLDKLLDAKEGIEEKLRRATPMKRFGKTEEIAAAIAYLSSEDAAYMTGHTLVLDGGISL